MHFKVTVGFQNTDCCCAPLRRLVCLPAEERGAQQLRHRDLLSDGHAEHQGQHAAGALLSDHLWALLQHPEDQRAAGWVSEGQGKHITCSITVSLCIHTAAGNTWLFLGPFVFQMWHSSTLTQRKDDQIIGVEGHCDKSNLSRTYEHDISGMYRENGWLDFDG